MAQMVECLPSKSEVLNSNPNTTKKKKERKKKKIDAFPKKQKA
jgi:hypothetical protein